MTFSPLVPPLYEATVTDWIRRSLDLKLGFAHVAYDELEEAAQNKRCPTFERLVGLTNDDFDAKRMARLRMGHLRYSTTGRNFTDVPTSVLKRIEAYDRDGNQEHLVDVYNLCEIEWIWPGREGTAWYEGDFVPVVDMQRAVQFVHSYKHFGVRSCLVAIALWAFVEYVCPSHERAHFAATDDGIHAEER